MSNTAEEARIGKERVRETREREEKGADRV